MHDIKVIQKYALIINNEIKKLINNRLYNKIKNNEDIDSIDFLRKIIKTKLENINKLINNGKK